MLENKPSTGNEHISNRPRIITTLSILAFIFGLYHLIKFTQAIIQWKILTDLPLTISPLYLAIDGLVWGISGFFVAWSLWVGKHWARKSTLVFSMIYAVLFWVDLIWIAEPIVLQIRWLFNLAATLLGLLAVYSSLSTKASRDYYNRNPAKIE